VAILQLTVRFLFLLSLIFWIGGLFFFAAIAGPSIFKTLDRSLAGEVVTSIFSRYYMLGYICGGAAIVLTVLEWATTRSFPTNTPAYAVRALLLVIMLALWGYAGAVLRPEAHNARTELKSLTPDTPAYEVVSKRFSALHKRSVVINGTVFIFGIATVFVTAYTNIKHV